MRKIVCTLDNAHMKHMLITTSWDHYLVCRLYFSVLYMFFCPAPSIYRLDMHAFVSCFLTGLKLGLLQGDCVAYCFDPGNLLVLNTKYSGL